MTGKATFISLLKGFADASDLDTRSAFGTTGFRIQIRNEIVDTGQVWAASGSGFVDILCAAVGAMYDLGGTDTDAIHRSVANEISTIPLKATPTGPEMLVVEDPDAAGAKRRLLVSSLLGQDGDAIHLSQSAEISTLTAKTVPTGAEIVVLEDPAVSYAKRRMTILELLSLSVWLTPVGPITATSYNANYGELVTMRGPS